MSAPNEFAKRDQILARQKIEAMAGESGPVTTEASVATVPSRKRRSVFNGTEAKLTVRQQVPGYHLHVFTDAGSRIQEALDSGYEFATPDEVGGVSENVISRNGDLGDLRIRFLVNPRADGAEQYGFLMKIRNEWFAEDQAELQVKNNRIDAAIRKGKITGDTPGFYSPAGGIKLQT